MIARTALLVVALLASCDSHSSNDGARSLHGAVRGPNGAPLAGATVYLVPADAVDDTAFDADAIRDGSSEDRDEPLEDLIRARGDEFVRAVAGVDGGYSIEAVPAGSYFVFAEPAANDDEHLPGGLGSRVARNADAFDPTARFDIELSSSPSASASFVGSTRCSAAIQRSRRVLGPGIASVSACREWTGRCKTARCSPTSMTGCNTSFPRRSTTRERRCGCPTTTLKVATVASRRV